MTLPESAYGKTLIADPDAAYLLTSNAAYRLVEGAEPVRFALELGIGPAATRDAFVFWSNGAVYTAPKKTGKARRVLPLAHEPQRFVTAGDRFAWLEHADDGRFTVQVPKGQAARVIYTTMRQVDAIAMQRDRIVLVERSDDAKWRFVGVPLAGGDPVNSPEHDGRTPAQLVVEGDIHYYDGNRFEIRRLAADLQSEKVLVKGPVCSPIAVSSEIYCGAMEGPFQISERRPEPRRLADGGGRSVTTLAANGNRVVWVRDEGRDKLSVEFVNVPVEPAP